MQQTLSTLAWLAGVAVVVTAWWWLRRRAAEPAKQDPLTDPTKAAWRRRWLPPLLGLAALVALLGGVTLGMTAATSVQRFVGWLLATAGVCTNVVAVWLLWWWGRSAHGGPPPRR